MNIIGLLGRVTLVARHVVTWDAEHVRGGRRVYIAGIEFTSLHAALNLLELFSCDHHAIQLLLSCSRQRRASRWHRAGSCEFMSHVTPTLLITMSLNTFQYPCLSASGTRSRKPSNIEPNNASTSSGDTPPRSLASATSASIMSASVRRCFGSSVIVMCHSQNAVGCFSAAPTLRSATQSTSGSVRCRRSRAWPAPPPLPCSPSP